MDIYYAVLMGISRGTLTGHLTLLHIFLPFGVALTQGHAIRAVSWFEWHCREIIMKAQLVSSMFLESMTIL